MKEQYYDNKMLLQNVADNLATLKNREEKEAERVRGCTNNEEWEKYKKASEEMTHERHKLETMHEVITNNLLHIQQELLKELLEIYKKKYINKRIGEKTKELIRQDLIKYIQDNYDIKTYCHISPYNDYNEREHVKISLYFEDFYYCYDLKQEEIRYNKETGESWLYYYQEVEYIPVNQLADYSEDLRHTYNENMKKIKSLKNEIERIREENNIKNTCCIKSTRIDIKNI